MLILTRNPGESIIIGENEIIITVLSVRSSQVRLGLAADEAIKIHRKEIYNRIQRKKIRDNQSLSGEVNDNNE